MYYVIPLWYIPNNTITQFGNQPQTILINNNYIIGNTFYITNLKITSSLYPNV